MRPRHPNDRFLSNRGGSRAWTRLRDQVVREEPFCRIRLPGICRGRSTTANHKLPSSIRPDLRMVRRNLEGACRPCNQKIRDMMPWQVAQLRAKLAQQVAQRRPSALEFFGAKQ